MNGLGLYSTFFSQLQGKAAFDILGEEMGSVKDLGCCWGDTGPTVTCLRLEKRHEVISLLFPWHCSPKGLFLETTLEQVEKRALRAEEFYIGKDLLDKQVIDERGRRLVRVNDIQVVWIEKKAIPMSVDLGIRGIFRRLGLEFMVKVFPQRLLGFQYFLPVEAGKALQLKKDYHLLQDREPFFTENVDKKLRRNIPRPMGFPQACYFIKKQQRGAKS